MLFNRRQFWYSFFECEIGVARALLAIAQGHWWWSGLLIDSIAALLRSL